jgi:hypothetical protein
MTIPFIDYGWKSAILTQTVSITLTGRKREKGAAR